MVEVEAAVYAASLPALLFFPFLYPLHCLLTEQGR